MVEGEVLKVKRSSKLEVALVVVVETAGASGAALAKLWDGRVGIVGAAVFSNGIAGCNATP